jgi:YesN/AraC family two-component response regulator
MPIMDGIAVLAAVKDRIEFRSLPIVVLSSIDDPEIIHKALKLGAKNFLIKPVTMSERIEMVRQLHSHWLPTATAPVARRILNP